MVRRGRGRRQQATAGAPARAVRSADHLRTASHRNPPDQVLSDDHVAHIHHEAVRFLGEHGIRILLPEAICILTGAGATVGHNGDEQMVRFPPELIDHALSKTPSSFSIAGADTKQHWKIGGDHLVLLPVGGPPFVSDLDHGRRAGTLNDFENFMRLVQRTDVLHGNGPSVEPQDVPVDIRHLHLTLSQLRLCDKIPFLFTRGRQRVHDVFEMLRINAGVDHDEFVNTPLCWANVNTNSPRQIDVPMSMGIIEMARFGQPCIITPFTLAGAMAPASLAGALLLQHLEVLAGVTLSQLTRPGVPVVYGGFTSNVDMRSGSPAFGTPEAVRAAVAGGQLARHVGLPFRSSGSSTSPIADAQGAWETALNMQGALRGGANVVLHAAGWQEGGLVASYEKFVMDVELVTAMVEAAAPIEVTTDELAYDTIAQVEPGGHFFGTDHTLARFETAFVEPIVAVRQSYEAWTEQGGHDARTRANRVWKAWLADFEPPRRDEATMAELEDFVARRTRDGGAPVE